MARVSPKIRCTGHKTNGDPCPNWAMHGQAVCWSHGGASSQARRGAQRRLALAQAERMVQLSGVDLDPVQHLLDCLHRAATLVRVWGVMVAALDDWGEEVVAEARAAAMRGDIKALRGVLHYTAPDPDETLGDSLAVSTNEPLLGFNRHGEAQIHPFVVQYESALERCAKFAKLCLDANVTERQIQIVERLGEQLSSLFERTVGAIDGLSDAQRVQAASAYSLAIAELEGPGGAVIDGRELAA